MTLFSLEQKVFSLEQKLFSLDQSQYSTETELLAHVNNVHSSVHGTGV